MKVSVIMPTANRPALLQRAIEGFLAQDWEDKELIILADITSCYFLYGCKILHGVSKDKVLIQIHPDNESQTIGNKRNVACKHATGEIILHMDDDDHYAPDWITKSVNFLIESGADLTGLSSAYFYKQEGNGLLSEYHKRQRFYDYQYRGSQPYVLGATMCYWKKTWEKAPFRDISEGEDLYFNATAGKVKAHGYKEGFCALIHGANTCSHRALHTKEFKEIPVSEEAKIFGTIFE